MSRVSVTRNSSAGTPATLTSYLFGAILTTTTSDVIVFAVLAEEFGFVGVVAVVGLFAVLVGRALDISRKAADAGLTFQSYLAASLPPEDPRSADLHQIALAVERGQSITDQLLEFGRGRPDQPPEAALLALYRRLAPG